MTYVSSPTYPVADPDAIYLSDEQMVLVDLLALGPAVLESASGSSLCEVSLEGFRWLRLLRVQHATIEQLQARQVICHLDAHLELAPGIQVI